MDEYISREDVLKKAKSSISVPADNEWDCGYNTAMAEMQEFIKHLTVADVQPVDRWIKADESLPVYGGTVLICDKSKNIRLGIYTDMGWCSQFGNPMMCKITHWQSLPEPPKDGDTNG